MAITIQTTTYKVIYIYSRDAHPGLLKIGKTSVEAYDVTQLIDNCEALINATKERLKEAITLGVTDIHIKHAEVGYFEDTNGVGKSFDDHAVHEVLLNSGYRKAEMSTIAGIPDEWFEVSLEKAKEAIRAVKNEQEVIEGPKRTAPKPIEIVFREEQERAIKETLYHFAEASEISDCKMLWNAKMRFGKTLCALELINRLDVKRVLILTHRPTVRSGWFDDYHLIKFTHSWQYGSKKGKKHAILDDPKGHYEDYISGKDLATMQSDLATNGTRYIYFASMQDLRGREVIRDKKDNITGYKWKDNNRDVYDTDWDLIIFDEAHEGTQTALGKEVIECLTYKKSPKKLYLSGTPFNILSQFDQENEIYTWDYVMEQTAKENWEKQHPDKPNPYEGLAKLTIYTYNLSEVFNNSDYKQKENEDYFNFSEFFRTYKGDKERDGVDMPAGASVGDFVHEKDITAFLDLLCEESESSQYPYSTEQFRQAMSHTLWMIPGIAEGARLATLINQHRLHTQFGFEVINVAGEGKAIEDAKDDIKKIEKQEKDALEKVKNALKKHKRTITISCGKLTTGVSIPEWTGVFMLSGGYSTGAANYMQTIFRGQTPYKNGAIKKNCYAFDFAPDRTLTVVDDYVKQQPKGGNGGGERKQKVESQLRFMPVIGMRGSQELEYNAELFIERVNQTYNEHIISHGFRSRHLFKNIATFTSDDHALLAAVGKLIGGAKLKTNSDGTLVLTQGGLTGEDAPRTSKSAKSKTQKPISVRPPKPPRDKDENEKRRHSQSVLDAIFVRFPLLLFGAVDDAKNMTVEDLITVIDDESWNEFMPHGFTKAIFKQIKHLIDEYNLLSSTGAIIKRAKEADAKPIQERIIDVARMIAHFHFPDKETVLTPWRVVNMHMVSTLGGYNFYNEDYTQLLDVPQLHEQEGVTSEIFCNPDAHVLEVNSKSGVYPLWIAHTFWALQREDTFTQEQDWALWKRVVENNLYVVCKTRMAEKITRRVLCGYNTEIHPNTVSYENLIDILKDEKKRNNLIKNLHKSATYGKEDNTMIEFEAVVGNPPYMLKSDGTSDAPIYHLFMSLGFDLSDIATFITPGRFLFDAGKTPKEFNQSILNDEHFYVVKYEPDSVKIFNNVDIKGGITITIRNAKVNYGKIVMFTSYPELNSILAKVTDHTDFKSIDSQIYLQNKFNLERLYADYPAYKNMIGSGGKEKRLTTSIFNQLDVFTEIPHGDDDVKILGLINNNRLYRYIPSEYIEAHANLFKYKVIIPASNGAGAIGEVLSTPVIGEPVIGYTQSFISIGAFESEHESKAALKYVKSKFMRTMLGVLKVTQHNHTDVWKFVPLQDFTAQSDIDWNKSVSEIDAQLYAKYGLSEDEIRFIEEKVTPME